MKTFKFSFVGRTVNAIGIFERFTVLIKAETKEAAILKLYDTHEHIINLSTQEVTK